jgi:release factor glutamine methyltransferase
LFAGVDGLDDLRVIVAEAPRWLVPGGSLVVELDPRQAETVAGLMTSAGFDEVAIIDDLTGRQRYVAGRIAVPG